ncbi:OmpA family protein [uncultured Flavobacterium sp.]|jgi:outer membrane protein OmpA-like peptidoglycan-associated protein/tetratricopeptide (TPR) repeat protein|uniref:OmpA family protein n=1 Tax=uncultured Flavobacterium sp. TaxID=165435 RepID=UPI00259436F9|nr:OmpA family protein [uncultured Flavobacterium sp.]
MKKIYLTLSFVIASGLLSAQNKDTKAADKLFDRYEYVDAAKEYLKLTENGKADTYVYKQLADSYYNVFNTKEAVKWYAKAVEQKQDAETYYKYAQMLKAEGNYAEADKQMKQFASLAPNDQRAKTFSSNPNYLPTLKNQSKLYDVVKSDISSDKTDFGAVLTNDNNVYFSSARNTSRRNSNWNEEPYLDLYKATYNANGTISEAVAIDNLNTKWHDGPATISSDGNTMYYGSESFNEKEYTKDKEKKAKFGKIYLYKATNSGGSWSNGKSLPFNNAAYDVRNPSISKDGKTLFFSSNMPGGFGGEDIWKVSVNGDEYGTPENLGAKINTEANESFPFITDDNVLFFSSNGKQGFGGLDVFKIDLNKGADAINVGAPVNTEKDDFSFTYNTSKKVGFFSSNRDGNDDIYKADPVCNFRSITIVRDEVTGKEIEGALVVLMDDKQKTLSNSTTDISGSSISQFNCMTSYVGQVSKSGYEGEIFNVTIPSDAIGDDFKVDVTLKPIVPIITEKEVILQPIYFEFNKSNITQQGAAELDKLVQVMNEHPTMVIFAKSHTDSRGSDKYNLNLSDRRAKSTVQYLVSKGIAKDRISGQGFGESEPKVTCDKCTEEEHSQNRRSEFLIVKK